MTIAQITEKLKPDPRIGRMREEFHSFGNRAMARFPLVFARLIRWRDTFAIKKNIIERLTSKMNFASLEKAGISYDEKYLWD